MMREVGMIRVTDHRSGEKSTVGKKWEEEGGDG